MLEFREAELIALAATRPFGPDQQQRLEYLVARERERPSLRQRAASRLVKLGLRLDPDVLQAQGNLSRAHA